MLAERMRITKRYGPSVYFAKKRLALFWRESVVRALLHQILGVNSCPTLLDLCFLRWTHYEKYTVVFRGQLRARGLEVCFARSRTLGTVPATLFIPIMRRQTTPRSEKHHLQLGRYSKHQCHPMGYRCQAKKAERGAYWMAGASSGQRARAGADQARAWLLGWRYRS